MGTQTNKKVTQAVILAGGKGERLRPLTDHIPKPMAPVNGIPYLDYLIHSVVEVGITKILFLLGYRADAIVERYFASPFVDTLDIDFSIGTAEDQTGKRVIDAYDKLDDTFMLLYGDNYWPIELDKMVALWNDKEALAMTTVFSNKNGTAEYGFENNIKVNPDSYVECYDKTRQSTDLSGVDIGYFFVRREAIDPRLKDNVSFEQTVLPALIEKHQLIAYITHTQYYYLTDIGCLNRFESHVNQCGIEFFSGNKQ